MFFCSIPAERFLLYSMFYSLSTLFLKFFQFFLFLSLNAYFKPFQNYIFFIYHTFLFLKTYNKLIIIGLFLFLLYSSLGKIVKLMYFTNLFSSYSTLALYCLSLFLSKYVFNVPTTCSFPSFSFISNLNSSPDTN